MDRRFTTVLGMAVMSCFLVGCASTGGNSTSTPAGWSQLRAGMSYQEVLHTIGRSDSELRESIGELINNESDARKEYRQLERQVRSQTGTSLPPMRSSTQVDQGDYLLTFKDGRLAEWQLR